MSGSGLRIGTGVGLTLGAVTANSQRKTVGTGVESTTGYNAAVDDFFAYMKETPAERMGDSWLGAHGVTRAALKAMSPEKRDAILKQMARELQDKVKQAALDRADGKARTS